MRYNNKKHPLEQSIENHSTEGKITNVFLNKREYTVISNEHLLRLGIKRNCTKQQHVKKRLKTWWTKGYLGEKEDKNLTPLQGCLIPCPPLFHAHLGSFAGPQAQRSVLMFSLVDVNIAMEGKAHIFPCFFTKFQKSLLEGTGCDEDTKQSFFSRHVGGHVSSSKNIGSNIQTWLLKDTL